MQRSQDIPPAIPVGRSLYDCLLPLRKTAIISTLCFYNDLTHGNITKSLLLFSLFALPMMAGNLLQQFYNIADTIIVGRILGENALAAVGSAYTLMTFPSR